MPGIPRGEPSLARNPTRQSKNVDTTGQRGKTNGFGTTGTGPAPSPRPVQPRRDPVPARASVVSSLKRETAFLAHLTQAPEALATTRHPPGKGGDSTSVANKLVTKGLAPQDGGLSTPGLKLPETSLESCQGIFPTGLGDDVHVEGVGHLKGKGDGPPRRGPTALVSCALQNSSPQRQACRSLSPPPAASQGAARSGPPAPSLDASRRVTTGRWTVFFAQVHAMGVSASVSLCSQALNAPQMGWGPDTLPHSFPGGWTRTPQLPHLLGVIVMLPPA